MNKDEYGEIVNGIETFQEIADKLRYNKPIIVGWNDEKYTHFDILFTRGAYKEDGNYLQRGLRGSELFVSVIGRGAFGFNIISEKDAGYIAEKLNICGEETIEKFGELINGVIKELV